MPIFGKLLVYTIQQCKAALEQIERNDYAARLVDDGMKTIVKYGISFYKKHCKVMV